MLAITRKLRFVLAIHARQSHRDDRTREFRGRVQAGSLFGLSRETPLRMRFFFPDGEDALPVRAGAAMTMLSAAMPVVGGAVGAMGAMKQAAGGSRGAGVQCCRRGP